MLFALRAGSAARRDSERTRRRTSRRLRPFGASALTATADSAARASSASAEGMVESARRGWVQGAAEGQRRRLQGGLQGRGGGARVLIKWSNAPTKNSKVVLILRLHFSRPASRRAFLSPGAQRRCRCYLMTPRSSMERKNIRLHTPAQRKGGLKTALARLSSGGAGAGKARLTAPSPGACIYCRLTTPAASSFARLTSEKAARSCADSGTVLIGLPSPATAPRLRRLRGGKGVLSCKG